MPELVIVTMRQQMRECVSAMSATGSGRCYPFSVFVSKRVHETSGYFPQRWHSIGTVDDPAQAGTVKAEVVVDRHTQLVLDRARTLRARMLVLFEGEQAQCHATHIMLARWVRHSRDDMLAFAADMEAKRPGSRARWLDEDVIGGDLSRQFALLGSSFDRIAPPCCDACGAQATLPGTVIACPQCGLVRYCAPAYEGAQDAHNLLCGHEPEVCQLLRDWLSNVEALGADRVPDGDGTRANRQSNRKGKGKGKRG